MSFIIVLYFVAICTHIKHNMWMLGLALSKRVETNLSSDVFCLFVCYTSVQPRLAVTEREIRRSVTLDPNEAKYKSLKTSKKVDNISSLQST